MWLTNPKNYADEFLYLDKNKLIVFTFAETSHFKNVISIKLLLSVTESLKVHIFSSLS